MPRFSIILPCYNAAALIGATLDSLRAQTLTDWEAICVDDGSTDATRAVIAAAARADPRIRLATHGGKGPSSARNHGARVLARGDILAFCDADDLWVPEKLAVLDRVFADRAVDAAYGRTGFFATDPARLQTVSRLRPGPLDMQDLLAENPVCTMSNLAVRRAVFAATGGFDPAIVHAEDLEWLIRLTGRGFRLHGIDRMLTLYRANPAGLSADLTAMARGRDAALRSARALGIVPTARAEAAHLRYLARRALRLDLGGAHAARLALRGLAQSPAGFLSPARRGLPTALGALVAPALPRPLRRRLFCS